MQHSTGTIKSVGYWAVVVTQALTMFNEHAFRVSIMLMATVMLHKHGNFYASLANIFYLMPYALFSVPAGFASDRFSKRSVFVFWKWMEVPILAFALSYIFLADDPASSAHAPPTAVVQSMDAGEDLSSKISAEVLEEATMRKIWLGIGVLFVFGMQAAFYSPSRYGILPEILCERQLSLGNGILELGSYVGVISGVVASGVIALGMQEPHGPWGWAPLLIPGATILSLLSSLLIKKVPAANPNAAISSGFKLAVLRRNWNILENQKGMLPTVAGLMLFWGMSTLYALNTLGYGKLYLGFGEYSTGANYLIVAISIGGGIGALLAGWISLGTVELGLVPIAAFLWFVFSIALGVTGLVAPGSFFWGFFWLLLSGVAAGLFIVPLNTFLEKFSPLEERASCIATSNVMTAIAMVVAVVLHLAMSDIFHFTPATIFILSGLFLLVSSYFIFRQIPDYFSRLAIVILTRLMYRLRVVGAENVPPNGPALIISNHVSFADGNLITACFKHFVRFVVFEKHYEFAFLKWLGTTMKAIPVDAEAPPKQIVQALRKASDAMANGEILCIFAEGSISRVGSLLPFRRGFEQIVKRVAIGAIWASSSSMRACPPAANR